MSAAFTSELMEILLVEDNPGDVRLTKEAFKEGALHNRLSVAKDGVEALEFLRQEGVFTDAPRPDVTCWVYFSPLQYAVTVPPIAPASCWSK